MKNIFVDTNIFVYAYSSTEPEKRDIALSLLSEERLILNTQVVNEFIWVMNRKYSIDMKKIDQIIKSWFKVYPIGLIDQKVIMKALMISQKHSFSYWDSLIISFAVLNSCTILYSED